MKASISNNNNSNSNDADPIIPFPDTAQSFADLVPTSGIVFPEAETQSIGHFSAKNVQEKRKSASTRLHHDNAPSFMIPDSHRDASLDLCGKGVPPKCGRFVIPVDTVSPFDATISQEAEICCAADTWKARLHAIIGQHPIWKDVEALGNKASSGLPVFLKGKQQPTGNLVKPNGSKDDVERQHSSESDSASNSADVKNPSELCKQAESESGESSLQIKNCVESESQNQEKNRVESESEPAEQSNQGRNSVESESRSICTESEQQDGHRDHDRTRKSSYTANSGRAEGVKSSENLLENNSEDISLLMEAINMEILSTRHLNCGVKVIPPECMLRRSIDNAWKVHLHSSTCGIVLSGEGILRVVDGEYETAKCLVAGTVFCIPALTSHMFMSSTSSPLILFTSNSSPN